MTDSARGFVATAAVNPISYVEWEHNWWFVYIAGIRTGTLIAGEASAMYRSAMGGEKMYPSLADACAELERIANWIVVANAELTNKATVYA